MEELVGLFALPVVHRPFSLLHGHFLQRLTRLPTSITKLFTFESFSCSVWSRSGPPPRVWTQQG